MENVQVKFNNKLHISFGNELKDNVYNYFKNNQISSYADWRMYLKSFLIIGTYFGSYFFILLGNLSTFLNLLICMLMGICILAIGCAIQHDANHGAFSEKSWINNLFGFSLNLVGGNAYMWKIKHNILHHTFTNIHGKDEDISITKIIRLSPNAPIKPIHKYQHIFSWFAYTTLTFLWVFYFDFPKLKRYNGNGSNNNNIKHPVNEVIILFVMKFFYFFYAIVIPIYFLPYAWWQVLLGFMIMHLFAGFLLTVTFQLAHVVEGPEHPEPSENGNIENSWLVHQLQTTSNFDPKNKALTWVVGGLNYQIEHHLFPKICSIHYPEISPIIKETAKKYGLPYYESPNLAHAIASHYNTLKKFSRA